MPGYELEKNWDRWWRLIPRLDFTTAHLFLTALFRYNIFCRKEEFNMSQILDEDLKSRAEYVEIAVNSLEQCAR